MGNIRNCVWDIDFSGRCFVFLAFVDSEKPRGTLQVEKVDIPFGGGEGGKPKTG